MHRCQGRHAILILDACTTTRDAMLYLDLMHGLQALMTCQPSSHTVESGSVHRHEFDWRRACNADGPARLAVLSSSAAQVQAAMITPGLHEAAAFRSRCLPICSFCLRAICRLLTECICSPRSDGVRYNGSGMWWPI